VSVVSLVTVHPNIVPRAARRARYALASKDDGHLGMLEGAQMSTMTRVAARLPARRCSLPGDRGVERLATRCAVV
jgi:hypothetical protein